MNPFFLKRTKVGPLELLPWTMTTQAAIHELKIGDWPEAEQVVACAWMQSREPEDVEQAISDGTAVAQIKEFKRYFPLALAKAVGEWCRQQSECIESGRVDVIPQPGESREDTPKNSQRQAGKKALS